MLKISGQSQIAFWNLSKRTYKEFVISFNEIFVLNRFMTLGSAQTPKTCQSEIASSIKTSPNTSIIKFLRLYGLYGIKLYELKC